MIKVKHIIRFVAAGIAFLIIWKVLEIAREKSVVNNEINIKWGESQPTVERTHMKTQSVTRTRAGLTVNKGKFMLDDRELIIRAGSVHYFRIMPDYWHYTLTALKSSGLNAVESCVPWNVHESIRGKFNWRTMNDLRQFISIAKELDLLVILRVGPYVNCDVDFGGLPAWLLGDTNLRVRSASEPYLRAYDAYVSQLAYRMDDMQYSNGGNVIAFEVENNVGAFIENKRSAEQYISELVKILRKNKLVEAVFTSETGGNAMSFTECSFALAIDGAEVDYDKGEDTWKAVERNARTIQARYSDAPLFVTLHTGSRTGLGDSRRNGKTDNAFRIVFENALAANVSYIISMFAGGTNFNFMGAGAIRPRRPIIASYDMDGLLSEYGTMREKYDIVHNELVGKKALLSKAQEEALLPDLTAYRHRVKLYDTLSSSGFISYERIVELMTPEPVTISQLGVPAEQIAIDGRSGDGATQGFIVYRTKIDSSRATKDGKLVLKVTGKMNDRLMVLVNYQLYNLSDPLWAIDNERVDLRLDLTLASAYKKREDVIVDLLVENTGRASTPESGAARWTTHARKGFHSGSAASINDIPLRDWRAYPLEFRPEFFQMIDRVRSDETWLPHRRAGDGVQVGPGLFKYSLRIERNIEPCDTFIEFFGYNRGAAFVNALGVGRYSDQGPQRTLFVPGAVMRHDYFNKFYLFELHTSPGRIKLSDRANFRP